MLSAARLTAATPSGRRRTAGILLMTVLFCILAPSGSLEAQTSIVDIGPLGTVPSLDDSLRYRTAWSLVTLDGSDNGGLPLLTNRDILTAQTAIYRHAGFEEDVPFSYDRGLEQYHLRGGRNGATSFTIDGLRITDPLHGSPLLLPAVAATREITILAGGTPVGHGNALSGVVNFITRSGGPVWSGSFDAASSEFSGAGRDDARDMTVADGHIGGPIPLLSGVTVFLAGSARTSRDYLVEKDDITFDLEVDPSDPSSFRDTIRYDEDDPYLQRGPDGRPINPLDIHAGWLGYGFDSRWDALANLSWKVSDGSRLRLAFSRNRQRRAPYTHPWRYSMFWGLPGEIEQNAVLGAFRYDADEATDIIPGTGMIDWPNEKNIITHDTRRYTFIWTGQRAPDIHYTIRAAYLDSDRSMRVQRWVDEEGLTSGNRNRPLIWDSDGNPGWGPAEPMTLVVLEQFPFDSDNDYARRHGYAPMRILGSFMDGSDRFYNDEHTITRSIKGDITASLLLHHDLRAGFSLNAITIDLYEIQLPDRSLRNPASLHHPTTLSAVPAKPEGIQSLPAGYHRDSRSDPRPRIPLR